MDEMVSVDDDQFGLAGPTVGTRNDADWKRGIRVGSAKDGKVTAFIPDPWTPPPRWVNSSAAGHDRT
jgi:hypothetical protein